jgi:type II secretory pathway predicted ATPase ExeA
MRDALVDVVASGQGTRSAFLTYEPYYGLKEKAFSLSADPRFLYKSRAHAPMFDELRAGIRRREGIIVLTGEPGTGKTTLCRSVLSALDRKTFCAFVPDPFVSREDLLKMLLIEFGVMSVEDVKSGRQRAATRPELSYPLYDFLRSLVPLQAYAVLIIDEAQNLASQLLEEIRILSDLEGPEKLLQLVLVGQPELREKLKDPTMRQVDQRISVRCSLQPLERDALPGYIAHRLWVAGGGPDQVEFSPQALDLAYNASSGNPRVLNLIADKSLHRGHLERTWIITPAIVTAALADLGYATPAPVVDVSATTMLPGPLPSEVLPPELFPPEDSLPERSFPEVTNEGLHFLLEEARAASLGEAPSERRGRRRVRRAALLATAGLVAAIGLALNEWQLRRQEPAQPLTLPSVAALAPPVNAGVAPVIPPAEFFSPVKP